MRVQRRALLCFTAVATLILASLDGAVAQKLNSRGPTPNMGPSYQQMPRGGGDGGYRGGGGFNGGWGAAVPGVLLSIPQYIPPGGGQYYIDDGAYYGGPQGPRQPPQNSARRGPSGAPPANERRLIPDEVVIEIPNAVSTQRIDALQRRFRLTRVESQSFQLTGTTLYRWRISDRRSVAAVVRALEGDAIIAFAQPNYLFMLQQVETKTSEVKPEGDPAQYELAKLRLPQAHAIAKGDGILVAVIDSGVDASHPELAGAIAQTFDAIDTPVAAHKHGTAIAGLIAAHGKLTGAAPGARILAIRAFDPAGNSAEGSTFNILKSLDWAVANGARIINMSFAGPADPAVHRSLEAARKKGIVLIAAAGNAGSKSPPLYPAADPNVIAVTATDADDKLFEQSNRGRHIAIAAPGAQILVAIPDGGYEVASGTSYSAAEVSGIVALMLERKSDLTPDKVRGILLATAKDLGPKGHDVMFGAGLADAYAAIMANGAPLASTVPLPVSRVSAGAR